MRLADEQRHNRADLEASESVRPGPCNIHVETAAIEGQRKVAEADLGPVRYLATLLGADPETALQWFVLVLALLLDSVAVLLTAGGLVGAAVAGLFRPAT
jgi:hypothetical protein